MFERGFKTWCEKYATDTRRALGLAPTEPLDASRLAAHLGVTVLTPNDVSGLSAKSKEVLLRQDDPSGSCWSAVTVIVEKKVAVVLNAAHSSGRQASDLMHELAHRILDHVPHEVDTAPGGILVLANYDQQQEEDADWLAGALLLPRNALVQIKRRKLEPEEAARTYGVSLRMLAYRLATTGVNRQFQNAERRTGQHARVSDSGG